MNHKSMSICKLIFTAFIEGMSPNVHDKMIPTCISAPVIFV